MIPCPHTKPMTAICGCCGNCGRLCPIHTRTEDKGWLSVRDMEAKRRYEAYVRGFKDGVRQGMLRTGLADNTYYRRGYGAGSDALKAAQYAAGLISGYRP